MKSILHALLPELLKRRLRVVRNHFYSMRFRKVALGRDVFIGPRVHVMGWKNLRIGDFSQIGHDTIVQANSEDPSVSCCKIGRFTVIAAHNFISIGKSVSFGDYCVTTPGCNFLGADHYPHPDKPYLLSGVDCSGTISIGANCFFGVGATVLKNVTIGHGSIIGAASLVTNNVPPFSLVFGSPARVVKRYRRCVSEWVESARFSESDELNVPDEESYVKCIHNDANRLPIEIATTRISDW